MEGDAPVEDVGCLQAHAFPPGAVGLLALRRGVLRFASERGWVLTGGWAQHMFLRDAGRPALYDESDACTMSDVDALCEDPIGELVALGARLHHETGVQLMVGCGMTINLFHITVNWGGPTLADVTGMSARTLAALPTRVHQLAVAPGETLGFRVLDPVVELARLHEVVSNVFEPGSADLAKRMGRIAALEAAVSLPTPPSPDTPAAAVTAPSGASMLAALREGGQAGLVARVPGFPEVVVGTAHAVDVLGTLLAAAPPGAAACMYARYPFESVVATVEVVAPNASGALLRVYILQSPVPLARIAGESRTSARTLSHAHPRFLAAHYCATSLWRRSLGDASGADARLACLSVTLRRAGTVATPAAAYAGKFPADTVYAMNLRRRARGAGCAIRHVTQVVSPGDVRAAADSVRAMHGARLHPLDGRLMATHACASLASSRDALVAALRAAVADDPSTDAMFPDRQQQPHKRQQQQQRPHNNYKKRDFHRDFKKR